MIRPSPAAGTRPHSTLDEEGFPPRAALLLPVVLLLHQVEEWFGGFPAWTRFAIGDGVEPGRFLLLNAVALGLCAFATFAAFRERRVAWIVVSMAALLSLNAILHLAAIPLVGRYSPGTATGLFLSLPLGVVVLGASKASLSRPMFFGAVLFGVFLHAVVTILALA